MDSIVAVSHEQMKEYLVNLLARVSVIRHGESTLNLSNTTYAISWRDSARPLTREEFELFMRYAPEFIVEPTVAQSGFNFGISLYEFPKSEKEKPQFFYFISGEYLPKELGQRFEDSWRILSPLSHNEKNERLLRAFGLDVPEKKSHYEY